MTERRLRSKPRVRGIKRKRIFERDDYTCVSCKIRFPPPEVGIAHRTYGEHGNHLTINHIIPWALGGSNLEDNLETMCWECNHADGEDVSREAQRIDRLTKRRGRGRL